VSQVPLRTTARHSWRYCADSSSSSSRSASSCCCCCRRKQQQSTRTTLLAKRQQRGLNCRVRSSRRVKKRGGVERCKRFISFAKTTIVSADCVCVLYFVQTKEPRVSGLLLTRAPRKAAFYSIVHHTRTCHSSHWHATATAVCYYCVLLLYVAALQIRKICCYCCCMYTL
jgi:hypothetical protein